MKYAFSTLGCPDWSWKDIISTAKDFGYNGVEIRGIEKEVYIPNISQFTQNNIKETVKQLQMMKLEISCLSSDCRMNERFKIDDHIKCAKEYIDIAELAAVKYVRILADTSPGPAGDVDIDGIAADLRHLAEYADNKNVEILVETNGVFADSEVMLKLLNLVGSDNIKVLWDVHHPFRFFNEAVEQTYSKLKDRIRYVHLKDSLMTGNTVSYQMIGHGDVPVDKALELLRSDSFSGYVSLEWLKRWRADLAEPGIVFPHFISYVKE